MLALYDRVSVDGRLPNRLIGGGFRAAYSQHMRRHSKDSTMSAASAVVRSVDELQQR